MSDDYAPRLHKPVAFGLRVYSNPSKELGGVVVLDSVGLLGRTSTGFPYTTTDISLFFYVCADYYFHFFLLYI